jgi:hypothetical protein
MAALAADPDALVAFTAANDGPSDEEKGQLSD